jgi:hypothetical protein
MYITTVKLYLYMFLLVTIWDFTETINLVVGVIVLSVWVKVRAVLGRICDDAYSNFYACVVR